MKISRYFNFTQMKYFFLLLNCISLLLISCSSPTAQQSTIPANPEIKSNPPAEKAYALVGTPDAQVNRYTVDGSEIELKDLTTENDKKYHNGELFTGYAISKMSNGNPFTLNGYKNGVKDGYYATWYGNGKIQQEGFFKNGVQDGINVEYYNTGQKQREHHWVMGKKNKAWVSWYENGKKWTHRDFANDNIHGKIYVWDEEGVLGKEYFYSNGVLTNKIMHFEENE